MKRSCATTEAENTATSPTTTSSRVGKEDPLVDAYALAICHLTNENCWGNPVVWAPDSVLISA